MAFTPSFIMVNTAGVAQSAVDLLQGLAAEAINLWGAALAGNATVTVQIEITTAASQGRADGTFGNGITIGNLGNFTLAEGGAAYELHGNADPGFTGPDIILRVDPDYLLNELFLDPTPATRGDNPIDKTDGLAVLLHEIGHALGFSGYFNEAAGNFFFSTKTPYDTRLVTINGQTFFDGPNVRAVFGGPVPLTDNSYFHYGNSSEYPGFTTDPLTGLMNGVVFYRGWNYAIGDLDLAFMADIGLGTTRDDILNTSFLTAMRGGLGNDTITGGRGDNLLQGDEGNDIIKGGIGLDTLIGGAGNDMLDGGTGDDIMEGGTGNDIYFYRELGDVLTEGVEAGIDEIRSYFNLILSADFENLRLFGDAIIGTGNDASNSIFAGGSAAVLSGLGGDDTLSGSRSGDTLNGGEGQDIVYGRLGADTLNGGDGNDVLRGEEGADSINGGAGDDLAFGGDAADTLHGDADNDSLRGEGASDMLFGDAGDDNIQGGDGDDAIYGGAGRDVLNGGTGIDRFFFDDGDFAGLTAATADRIQDFTQGQDRIQLKAVDAIAGGADNAFAFIGTAAFGQVAGQLRYSQAGGVTLVQGDVDGDGIADFTIALTGTINLAGTDFTL